MGLVLKGRLESFCCSNGWCYGVFWRFDQRNSMLLTMEDAYYEEEMEAVINNLLPHAHMLGEGIVGQAASTGEHQWIFSDADDGGWNSATSTGSQDIFQDDSEIHCQFYSGIKTIAVISVESQGVVQFGSTQKILEKEEFLDQIKRLFSDMVNIDGLTSNANLPSSLSCESYDLNEWFDSLGNEIITPMHGGNGNELMEMAYSSMNDIQSSVFTLDSEQGRMSPLCLDSSFPTTQLQTAIGAEAQTILSSDPNNQLQQVSSKSPFISKSTSQTPCTSTWSNDGSILTSSESTFLSETVFQDSSDVVSTKANLPLSGKSMTKQHSAPLIHASESELSEKETGQNKSLVGFNSDDLTTDLSKSCVVDNIFEWLAPSREHRTSGMATMMNEDLPQSGGLTSASSGLIGDLLVDIPSKQSATSVQSSFTEAHNCRAEQKSTIMNRAENDLFEGLEVVFRGGQAGDCLENMMMPVVSSGQITTSSSISECISELDIGSTVASRKGLFSELGLEELLDSISHSSYGTRSSIDDHLSTTKRRRVEIPSANSNQHHLVNVSCSSSSMMMLPAYNLDKANNISSKKEVLPKSQVSLWIDDSYSINAGSSALAKPKKTEEPTKPTKKRARPGESSRPRPKDRQQIQDRIAELKQIIPDGAKCSIDALLDRTIKHLLFLQSVTKYAEKLKQADEPKLIGQESKLLLKDNSTSGATWALEVSDQTMLCPIIVEDLSQPGLMLIEMLCEDQGFFLEIADLIKGFGLNILKGLMESRDDKIWARFIVEASMHITRMDVFWSLLQLLERSGTSEMDLTNQPKTSMNGMIPQLNNYQLPALPCPISLTEALK